MKKRIALLIAVLYGCSEDPSGPRADGGWATVSPSLYHTCALDLEGVAYCWGRMGDQLGVKTPQRVPTDVRFRSITTGFAHTCALDAQGQAYCWGRNEYGQLGNRAFGTAMIAEPVTVATDERFRVIEAGSLSTCAMTHEGEVHCWGINNAGQLGTTRSVRCLNDELCATTPRLAVDGTRFKHISMGVNGHSVCGLTVDGAGVCWGSNHWMQLGVSAVPKPCETLASRQCSATALRISGTLTFDTISSGSKHGCGLANNRAYCWGSNVQGEVGMAEEHSGDRCYSNEDECFGLPIPVAGSIAFRQLAPGGTFTCGIGVNGDPYCWGNAVVLGDPNPGIARSPVKVQTDVRFTRLESGVLTVCGITESAELYCWGLNNEGQAGTTSNDVVLHPTLVARS